MNRDTSGEDAKIILAFVCVILFFWLLSHFGDGHPSNWQFGQWG